MTTLNSIMAMTQKEFVEKCATDIMSFEKITTPGVEGWRDSSALFAGRLEGQNAWNPLKTWKDTMALVERVVRFHNVNFEMISTNKEWLVVLRFQGDDSKPIRFMNASAQIAICVAALLAVSQK